MLTKKDRVEDVRDVMWQLERDGEIVVHRVLGFPRAGHGEDALRLGQEDPDAAPLAPQVLRPVRQHPRVSRRRCCG